MEIPSNNRAELWNLKSICEAYGLKYTDIIWSMRSSGTPVSKPRSKSWPSTSYSESEGGYKIQWPVSNVLPLKRNK